MDEITVVLTKVEIEEILNGLYCSINESQYIDENVNIAIQDKLSELLHKK